MRTLMKVSIPVEGGNQSIKNGRMSEILEKALSTLRPEAAYFYPERGRRTALIVFDLKEPADLPVVTEPFFMELNAEIETYPCMNADDVKAGLSRIKASEREPVGTRR